MEFLSEQKAQQLYELAETARTNLSKFSGTPVDFDAKGLSLLDEWIDRYIQHYDKPTSELNMIWGAFLGEAIRRKCGGQWGIKREHIAPLGIICTTQGSQHQFVDTQAQIRRRIQDGIQASLVYYYTIKGIEINMV